MAEKPRFTPSGFIVDKEEAFEPLQLRALAEEARLPRALPCTELTPLRRLVACACGST